MKTTVFIILSFLLVFSVLVAGNAGDDGGNPLSLEDLCHCDGYCPEAEPPFTVGADFISHFDGKTGLLITPNRESLGTVTINTEVVRENGPKAVRLQGDLCVKVNGRTLRFDLACQDYVMLPNRELPIHRLTAGIYGGGKGAKAVLLTWCADGSDACLNGTLYLYMPEEANPASYLVELPGRSSMEADIYLSQRKISSLSSR